MTPFAMQTSSNIKTTQRLKMTRKHLYYFLNLAQPNDVFFMQERSLQKSTVPVDQHLSVALTDLLKKEEYNLKALR